MSRALRAGCSALLAVLALGVAPAAQAADGGVQRLTYEVGPLQITPGQNRIGYKQITPVAEKPAVDGWILSIKPNLVRADGSVPSTERVMFHHGVWVNGARSDSTGSFGERFFAAGEEKTKMTLPDGFGYRYRASDFWLLNHMVHNLTTQPMTLYVTYTIRFVPDGEPAAEGLRPVRPIWMDVVNGSVYPVFDVRRGSGGRDGEYVYPRDATNPYPSGVRRNMWQVDRDGVLVAGFGHVHSGGLSTDLWMRRTGARYRGPDCGSKPPAQRRRCRRRAPSVRGNRAHIFESDARYWEPAGPISWDVSMKVPKPNWRVAVRAGDMLEISTTYESRRGSWYESMGIMVLYMADGGGGKNPYRAKVDRPGAVTHGHLPENNVHGGGPTQMPDPRSLPPGGTPPDPLTIDNFLYGAGDLRRSAPNNRPPVVRRGDSLVYELSADEADQEIWHSLTSCAPPCNRSTGIAYPIADAKWQFDSGQLGTITPAVGRTTWEIPQSLPNGTYTYFCRIHPSMRGAFRVKK